MSLLEPGFRLGKYEVVSHIATGGMGAVYKAMDLELRRPVALKILDPELAARENWRERFQREARHAARLSHKNIVTLYEAGKDQGYHFLAMEFIQGIDLELYIRRKGRLGVEETRRLLIQAVKALAHAHGHGIVHRDIKPSNFLLTMEDGKLVVKLADMGLAHIPSEEAFRVTRAGCTVGTVDYMAPEQARNSATADIRSDIYALGCTAYHMLVGQPPFPEGGLGERIYKHMEEPPPDLRQVRPEVSPGLWAILQRMLAKKQEDRHQTPADLLLDLKRTPGEAVQESPVPEPAETPTPSPERPSSSEETAVSSDEEPLTQTQNPDPTPAPAEWSRPPSRKKKQVPPRPSAALPPPKDGAAPVSASSSEQVQAASGQFERVRQLLAEDGDHAYLRQLLLSCCKLEPGNILYRKTLRELQQEEKPGLLRRWFGSLSTLTLTARVKAARRNGEHRKVLEQGEEVLAQDPAHVATHLEMAESATALGLLPLAVWLLEQGHKQAPDSTVLMRTLAQMYEQSHAWSKAIHLWEKVRKREPDDLEPPRKISALSARAHLAKGHYTR